jgi:hypothetical protein
VQENTWDSLRELYIQKQWDVLNFLFEFCLIYCLYILLLLLWYICHLHRRYSEWPGCTSRQACRRFLIPVMLWMDPGVYRVYWKAWSILNLSIPTFSTEFALFAKFIISYKREQKCSVTRFILSTCFYISNRPISQLLPSRG